MQRARMYTPRRARRGVASVLSMMFLVIFGALAAAMAVVAQGNLRTADASMKVSRAMSAAETGLVFARQRLQQESARFVTEQGIINSGYGADLWLGTYPQDGTVVVLDPVRPVGYVPTPASGTFGVIHSLFDAHLADEHDIIVNAGDTGLPQVNEAFGTLRVRPIALDTEDGAAYFRLTYELLEGEPMIRVTSEGWDGDVSRVLQMDFRITKKIEFAVISPNRIMIGKNVMVEGPLGSRYGVAAGELDTEHGDPLVMRSDFYYLSDALNTELDTFFGLIVNHDVDGDGRLRPDHPTEGGALGSYVDYDGDEYVDDFDLFLNEFDDNGDVMVCYDSSLAASAGLGTLSEEFADVDNQLARLIDEAFADRDGDGELATNSDRALGYQDGVIDEMDLYAKVTGRLAFAVNRTAWENAHGESYQTIVNGPVRTELEQAATTFDVPDGELLDITSDMFFDEGGETWYEQQVPVDPADFTTQGAAGYEAPNDDTWEAVPFGAIGAYDYYNRPVYRDVTFNNVRIPMGTNALFENCTFVGVTYIESYQSCDHIDWNYAGAWGWFDDDDDGERDADEYYFPKFTDETGNPRPAELSDGTPIADSRPYSNNIRFDNCTFLGTLTGDRVGQNSYTYAHWRNKIQMTGNTRFYVDPDDEELLAQDDSAALRAQLLGIDQDDRVELAKSSVLMPGWSVDVGNFANEVAADPDDTASVKLRGVIIAGILDVRGTADVWGTVLMTFRPEVGEGPLAYGGQPDAFNTTLGYFGPLDGDSEGVDPDEAGFEGFGEIRLRYNPDALLPDGIPWPISMEAVPDTYVEGGSS